MLFPLLLQVAKCHFRGGRRRRDKGVTTALFGKQCCTFELCTFGAWYCFKLTLSWLVSWVESSPTPADGSCSPVVLLIWLNPSPFWLAYCDSFLWPLTFYFLLLSSHGFSQQPAWNESGINSHWLFLAFLCPINFRRAISSLCVVTIGDFSWPPFPLRSQVWLRHPSAVAPQTLGAHVELVGGVLKASLKPLQ